MTELDSERSVFDKITEVLGTAVMVKEKLNDPELSEARINVCKTLCPFYKPDINFCGKCMCNCTSKSKSKTSLNRSTFKYELTHCPNGIWPIRTQRGDIGENDEHIANIFLKLNGKEILKQDRVKFIN